MLIEEIKKNPKNFENVVIVGDGFYFTYSLMHFLHDNNISFIIRAKGNAKNSELDTGLNKHMKDYEKVCSLRQNVWIVKCENQYDKKVFNTHKKKSEGKTYNIRVKNDCVLITNLIDVDKYSDNDILNLYRQRYRTVEFYLPFFIIFVLYLPLLFL